MSKKLLSVFAIASMMLATSCSNEELSNVTGKTNSTVTLTTQLANPLQTRAFADGTTATTLDYAVYEVESDTWTLLPDLTKKDETINMTKTVSLNLVNGKSYAVVFWADAPSSIYTFSPADKKVTADYTSATCSNEAYDAFYAVEKFTVNGENLNRTVELKRPFAQLNIGTSDLAAAKSAGINVTKAGVKVNTYNTLNFEDGTVAGEEEVTFAAATLPEETFPVTSAGCNYLTMNYLLMPTDKKADNTITISYDGAAQERVFQNIPLRRNYRTNIYGTLLTSTNNFNVTINPEFETPDYALNVWDGTSTEITPNADGVYEVTSGAQLAWIAEQTTSGANTFEGKTVKLMSDIDLNNRAWAPIGDNSITTFPGHTFAGTFDGNGMTIYNLNVETSVANYAAAGLFGTVNGATIKDLTIKNATVKSTHFAGTIVGYADSKLNGNEDVPTTIEGCTVENAKVTSTAELISAGYDNGDKVGGIMGYVKYGKVNNNTVKNATVTAYRDFGGIVGTAGVGKHGTPVQAKKSQITGNTIENVTLVVDKTHNYKNYTTQDQHNVASILGRNDKLSDGTLSAVLTDNTGNATITY